MESGSSKKRATDDERTKDFEEKRRRLRKDKRVRVEEADLDELPEPDDQSDETYSHNEWETDSSSTDSQSSVLSSSATGSSDEDSSDSDVTKKPGDDDGSSSDEAPSQLDVCESRYRLLYHSQYGGLTDIQKHVYESIVADSEWGPVTPHTFASLSDDQRYDVLDHYARAWLTQTLPFPVTENRVKHIVDALKF